MQICLPEDVVSVLNQEGAYEPISTKQIALRLKAIQSDASPLWTLESEQWSLGGAQGKVSLARFGDHWNSCTGSAATTHLIKPGVKGFSWQCLNEFLCMRLASTCGLQVSNVSYEVFDDVPTIVVERYDREVLAPGVVTRLHQEDLCQALGYKPSKKYKPTASEVLQLLARDTTRQSTLDFAAALFFNYLVGATDAHAKNYSLMHLAGSSFFLAPLYDIASIFPYEKRGNRARATAMVIGKEKRFGRLTGSHIDRFARVNGLDTQYCRDLMISLAKGVGDNIGEVVQEYRGVPGVSQLGGELIRTVRANCEAMLNNMNRDGKTVDLTLSYVISSGTIPLDVA